MEQEDNRKINSMIESKIYSTVQVIKHIKNGVASLGDLQPDELKFLFQSISQYTGITIDLLESDYKTNKMNAFIKPLEQMIENLQEAMLEEGVCAQC